MFGVVLLRPELILGVVLLRAAFGEGTFIRRGNAHSERERSKNDPKLMQKAAKRPQISGENSIRLDISQESSDVVNPDAEAITIFKRILTNI